MFPVKAKDGVQEGERLIQQRSLEPWQETGDEPLGFLSCSLSGVTTESCSQGPVDGKELSV